MKTKTEKPKTIFESLTQAKPPSGKPPLIKVNPTTNKYANREYIKRKRSK